MNRALRIAGESVFEAGLWVSAAFVGALALISLGVIAGGGEGDARSLVEFGGWLFALYLAGLAGSFAVITGIEYATQR